MKNSWLAYAVLFSLCLIVATDTRGNNRKDPSATIDRLVFSRLKALNIPPSERCSDEVFLRRVYLDTIGTLPTQEEARRFFASNRSDKRSALIEELFLRPEFADYWSLKWCDLLRVKAEFPSKLWPNAVQAYHRWVHSAIKSNMPYDQFSRELLTSSGSNFREPPVNFYRAMPVREPEEMARIAALTFMGMRTEHWPPRKRLGLAAFFGSVEYKKTAEWKEEIVFFDPTKKFVHPETGEAVQPVLPDGTEVRFTESVDPRHLFADWLTENEVFSRCMVNRIWYWMLGRGIIHEVDDLREDNPAQNEALLTFLANELVGHHYDLLHIYRIILNSDVYQLSSVHNAGNLKDEVNFSRYYVRRLDAEVLIDAICQITGTTEAYSSSIPEPFTYIPENQRSIKLADGSITSPFLDLFGRPPRDTGYESERDNTPSSSQKLHLLNSTHIQKKILQNKALLGMSVNPPGRKNKQKVIWASWEDALDGMYLSILSRYPTEEERNAVLKYNSLSENRYETSIDLVWALLNTQEFIYRH